MGKKLVIVGFVFCFVVALYVFFAHDRQSLRKNLDGQPEKVPRVVMEDFAVYRYTGDRLKSVLTARLGQFFEPNVIELDGEVKAERNTNDGLETASAETAMAYFDAKSLAKLMQDTHLTRAEMSGFVEVGMKNHLLSTDYAEYLASANVVRSNRPVQVDGPGREFTSDDGFTYDVSKEELDMIGLVKGVVRRDEKK